MARTICLGEAQKQAVIAPHINPQGQNITVQTIVAARQLQIGLTDIAVGCMAQRGYILAPREQADGIARTISKSPFPFKKRNKLDADESAMTS